MDERLDIGTVADRAGVRPSALRYYEDEGLIAPAGRAGGRRIYGPSVLTRLAVIDVAQRAGFRIREIRELFEGAPDGAPDRGRWRELVERKLPEVRALARRAEEMERWLTESLRCDCLTLDDCPLVDEGKQEDAEVLPK